MRNANFVHSTCKNDVAFPPFACKKVEEGFLVVGQSNVIGFLFVF